MYTLDMLQMILFMQRDPILFQNLKPGFSLSDELLYKILAPLSTEPELKSYDTCPWPEELFNELLYELTAQLSDEEQDKMDTSKPPATLFQPPKHGCTTRTPRQETHLDHSRLFCIYSTGGCTLSFV